MKLEEITEIYDLISRSGENITTRKYTLSIRKKALSSSSNCFTKIAFDTRRIDQENTYIPRRGLQNYHRSEQFISDAMYEKIQGFNKLNKVLEQLKKNLGKEPEWQDSYTRVLASAVQRGLRLEQLDGDFSDTQPSMASLAYLEELLYVRYRLTLSDLSKLSENNLSKIILRKDEVLMRKTSDNHCESPIENNIISSYQEINNTPTLSPVSSYQEITSSDVSKYSYQDMLEKIISSVTENIQKQIPNLISQAPKLDTAIIANQDKHEIINKNSNNSNNSNNGKDDRTITITIKG